MASKLKPARFGLATAIVWCVGVFFLGVMATYLNRGKAMVAAIGSIYPGYRRGLRGIIIGALWAFIDGFFGGAFFALIYNLLGGSGHCNRYRR